VIDGIVTVVVDPVWSDTVTVPSWIVTLSTLLYEATTVLAGVPVVPVVRLANAQPGAVSEPSTTREKT
jgi:hypothetical protein